MKLLMTDLESIHERGIFRQLLTRSELLDFSSNDYLGLSQSPEIRGILIEALTGGLPLGSTGSRLLSGNLEIHERVENFLSRQFQMESALLFYSGYMANMAVLSALGHEQTEFFSDALSHASLIDGIRNTKARKTIFQHNDMNDLQQKLSMSKSARKVIVTESVFSMDGDLAPLEELLKLAREFDAWLVIDEAHATGVFGNSGLGRLEDIKHSDVNLIAIHTCGKALGAQGAFVLSSKIVRELLINNARAFIFSTAISPLLALQVEASVRLLPGLISERQHLLTLARDFRESIRGLYEVGASESQIIPIILGSNELVMKVSTTMREKGLDVRAIRSPTVTRGTERLRISLKSFHTENDLVRLQDALHMAVKQ